MVEHAPCPPTRAATVESTFSSFSDASMRADTAQIAERSWNARPAVERHTGRRHVRVTATLHRSQLGSSQLLPVAVAMPIVAGVIVERAFHFIPIFT